MSAAGGENFPIHEGYCVKLGAIFKTWRRRWFVLTKTKLSYYKKPGDAPKGEIIIESGEPYIDTSCKKQPAFAIRCPKRTYQIHCDTEKECKDWVDAINLAKKHRDLNITQEKTDLDSFEILKVIGKGAYGKVRLVRHKKTGKIYAMKSLSKKKLQEFDLIARTVTEKNVLLEINHPFLVSARFSFQDSVKVYLVLDYVQGGELFQRLHEEGKFDESRVQTYAAQLVLAIQYLHSKNIIHRDLKPENILVDDKGYLRITDFGLVKELQQGKQTQTFCGTPEYIAPEMIEGSKYDRMVDWWSIGILIFEMLYGGPPFYNTNVNTMYRLIQTQDIADTFPPDASDNARDLICGLCAKDPTMRLGSRSDEDIKNHPFFEGVNWDKMLEKELEMPWKPVIKDDADADQFDEMFTAEDPKLSYEDEALVSTQTQEILNGFTYQRPDDHM